jgi:hypothetical protein
MAATTSGHPFAEGAPLYLKAGWRGILHLPPNQKSPPPSGHTGATGPDPTLEQVQEWISSVPDGNVAIRMPHDVIGVDVDAYRGKVGRETLARLEVQLGALPKTVTSTARSDGVSGIHWFRVPAGRNWHDAGPDVQIIWWGHRYAVVWPSVHPDGGTYGWFDSDGARLTGVPAPADLAELPEEWQAVLGAPDQRSQSTAEPGSGFAGWTASDGTRVDVEAILRGELDGCSSQRDALIRLIASGWAYGVHESWIRIGCSEAISNFPQTKPEPWTDADVDALVTDWCAKHTPGKSSEFDFALLDTHIESARRLVGLAPDADDETVKAWDSIFKRRHFQNKADRISRRLLDEEEAEANRAPRVRRTAREFAKVPPPEIVMAEVLAAEVNLLGGPSAAGKSLLARDWALHVAAGIAWRGHRVPGARGVLWVASEGTHDFADRWQTRPLWEQAADRIFVLDEPVNLLSETDVTDLLAEYAQDDIGLVVFDVIYGMGMADDNGVKEVTPVIHTLKRISREWGAATLALGHNGHNGERRFRGSSMWRQLAAVEHHMNDLRFSCEKSKIGDHRRLGAAYALEYPAVAWRAPMEAVKDEASRRRRIEEDIKRNPTLSDIERARQLAPDFGQKEDTVRKTIAVVKKDLKARGEIQ